MMIGNAQDIMKRLYLLIAKGILPIECFTLYWYYWLHKTETHTLSSLTKIINRRDVKTVAKYNRILATYNLLCFVIARKKGVSGFTVTFLKLDDDRINAILKKHTIKEQDKIADKNEISKLLCIVTYHVPANKLPKKWEGRHIKMFVSLAKKVDFDDYVAWLVKYKMKKRNYDWFVNFRFSSKDVVTEYLNHKENITKVSKFKDIKNKDYSKCKNAKDLLDALHE